MHSLKGLAGSFISMFIPIYLLTLHYSLTQVFVYYLIYFTAILFLFLVASLIARNIGLKRTIILYFPFQLAYLIFLYVLPFIHIPLWIIAITSATAVGFYWYPLHLFFISQAQKKEMGNSVGKLYAFPKIVTVASPLIGGFVAVLGGFSYLIILTIVLYIASSVSLFYLPDIHPAIQFKLSRFLKLARTYPRYIFAEIGENIREELSGTILPIFIFITFGSILSVGFIGMYTKLGSAIFMIIVGRYTDKLKSTNILRIGVFIITSIWITFFYTHGTIPFYVLTLLEGFFSVLLLIPFNAITYNYAQKQDSPAEFIIFREVPVTIARVFVYSCGLFLVTSLNYLFLLPVAGTLLFLVL